MLRSEDEVRARLFYLLAIDRKSIDFASTQKLLRDKEIKDLKWFLMEN